MNMHNFPLGPAKPGDGPTPDGGRFSRSPSGTPIGTMAPTANGVEIVSHQRAPSPPRIAVRALSPITAGPAALRDALFRCADAMADGFGRDWEREQIERRARAWEQRQRHG